ncbi:uncharacterized protein LOC121735992 isoform X1 [Aricia agestis]|uniref:uncharacterized protein LOC121735992 isoform X1 n=1 Tax=Aricia agestis TaxID=91739 RepID=UPI001C208395|nr:uncharacterized protein LOC121735992 isoform X1 [Aricia agestis]
MGFSQRIKMKEGILPSKFFCQQGVEERSPISDEWVQNIRIEGYESISDPLLTVQKERIATDRVKRVQKKQIQTMQSSNLESRTRGAQECESNNQSMFTEDEASYKMIEELPVEFQDLKNRNSEGSSRTISIETEHIEDDDEPTVTVKEETNEDLTTYSYTEPISVQEVMKCEDTNTEYKQVCDKSTSKYFTADKSVQYHYKPKFRSKAVQTVFVNTHPSPLRTNMSHYNVVPPPKDRIKIEIRELETSVRIADRKLYRSWEAIRDSKDPEAYESLLDEVKNKQKTLSYMLQLIENRQALLLREQKNEAEDDAVVALPTRKNQDNRRCFKRRKRAHESKSDHKTQVAPKQVTLYITGSSTVDETESSRRSSELPSMEMSQEPTPNIMFFTTCLQPI